MHMSGLKAFVMKIFILKFSSFFNTNERAAFFYCCIWSSLQWKKRHFVIETFYGNNLLYFKLHIAASHVVSSFIFNHKRCIFFVLFFCVIQFMNKMSIIKEKWRILHDFPYKNKLNSFFLKFFLEKWRI